MSLMVLLSSKLNGLCWFICPPFFLIHLIILHRNTFFSHYVYAYWLIFKCELKNPWEYDCWLKAVHSVGNFLFHSWNQYYQTKNKCIFSSSHFVYIILPWQFLFKCNGIRWPLSSYLHHNSESLLIIFVCWTQLSENRTQDTDYMLCIISFLVRN